VSAVSYLNRLPLLSFYAIFCLFFFYFFHFELSHEISRLPFPEKPEISPQLKDLLTKMTEKDTTKRLKLDEAMQHSWVTKSGKFRMGQEYETIEITQQDMNEAITVLNQMHFIVSDPSLTYA
jgi:serine/threonine protein kinase